MQEADRNETRGAAGSRGLALPLALLALAALIAGGTFVANTVTGGDTPVDEAAPDPAVAPVEPVEPPEPPEPERAEDVLQGLAGEPSLEAREAICDRAIEIDPEFAPAWVARARVRFAIDRRAAATRGTRAEPEELTHRARKDLVQATRFDPASAAAYLLSAQLYVFENDGRAALGSLRRVEELDPNGALGCLAYGLKEEMGRRYTRAIARFDEALRFDPDLVEAHLGRARAWIARREYVEALADAERAVELNPLSAEAVTLLARARYFARGERSRGGVLELLERALKLDPSHSQAWALRAYVRLERSPSRQRVLSSPGDCKLAVEDAERANRIRPEVLAFRVLAEIAFWVDEDKTKAQKYAKTAILLNGRDPDSFLLRAKIRMFAATYPEADRDLERAFTLLEAIPGGEATASRGLTMRAGIRLINKDFTSAKDMLRRALKLDEENAEAHFYLAKALHHDPKRQAGDWKLAEERYTRSITLDRHLADAWFHRGALKIDRSRGQGGKKEWKEALVDLEQAETLLNSRHSAYFKPYYLDLMRGIAYQGLEEWSRAAKHYQAFVDEASPGEGNFAFAKKQLRLLEELRGK